MGQTTDHIEQHIYQKRNELGEHVHELQYKAKRAVDWRVQVSERPWTMVGIAFAAGLAAAFVTNRSSLQIPQDGKTSRMWNDIKSAAGAAILAKAKEFGEEVIPRFREEYRKRELEGTSRSGVQWTSVADAERRTGIGSNA